MSFYKADRLSSLPHDIRSHILSLMPTKFAARTCILSKTWRYSWMFVTNLNFDKSHPVCYTDSFSKSMDRLLNFPKRSQLKSFRLRFTSCSSFQRSRIASWIDKAVMLNVVEIDIHVHQHDLPLSFFTCKTLTELNIDWCVSDESDIMFPCSVNLPCLKTLDIVVYYKPVCDAFKLIGGCPLLENLSLEITQHVEKEDYVFDILTLKRLKLTVFRDFWIISNEVTLKVPNLEYLFVGGTLRLDFVLGDMSSLVEASFSFIDISIFDSFLVELLKGVSGVKSLSLQYVVDYPEQVNPLMISPLPVFLNMTRLELKGFWNYGVIFEFLEQSLQLRHLYIEKEDHFERYFKTKPQKYDWIIPKDPACMLTNLTTVKYSMSEMHKFDEEFLEFLIQNAKVLKTLNVTWKYLCVEEAWLCSKLNNVPKASPCCEIHLNQV